MQEVAIYTKALPWNYEEEWRVINGAAGPRVRVFESRLLTGVILGARISPEDQAVVAEWAKKHSTPVDIYKATLAEYEFAINIVPMGSAKPL